MKTAVLKEAFKKSVYFSRELSWLAFNERVLDQAFSEKYPLLERVRFLSYVSINLNEFFEIRVAGLLQQIHSGVSICEFDEGSMNELLQNVIHRTDSLLKRQYDCWNRHLCKALENERIFIKKTKDLSTIEKRFIEHFFNEHLFPILTPLAIDPAHPFPLLINKAIYLLISLADPDNAAPKIAILPVPSTLPRMQLFTVRGHSFYIFITDILKLFLHKLFPGYKVAGSWALQVTRNSELYIDDEEVVNLLLKIEEELHNRHKGAAVRLEIEKEVPLPLLNTLLEAIPLPRELVFFTDGPISLAYAMEIYAGSDRPDLKYKPYFPALPSWHQDGTVFSAIQQKDILLHHPYDSFESIVAFIETAALDPNVLAIKQTLYRTDGHSPIIEALKKASKNGKQVTALVELKARFDEANNIHWARELEEDGVHVVYGMVGLKTHCKCCLILRREGDVLSQYVHLGTGNYNSATAKSYVDISLLTCDKEIASETAILFNTLTGFVRAPQFKKLWVAPFNFQERLHACIRKEIENAKKGKPARIIAKVNSLSEQSTIDLLYTASQAGVSIDLIVRGICCLIPGMQGLSENIQVRSILGRYFEHSRIFYFQNAGGTPLIFAGSADWMPRNFFRRIEVIFPIQDPQLRKYFYQNILLPYLKDNTNATSLWPDGSYQPIEKRGALYDAHKYFMNI